MKRGALLAVLVLAGCGGAAHPPKAAKPPHIPRVLAQAWETEASSVARALAAGDGCTALHQATALRNSVARAHARVPARLRAPLATVVEQLPGRITCNPPAPAPAAPVVQSPPQPPQHPIHPAQHPPHPPHPPQHGHPHDRGRGHDHGDHG